MAKQRTQSVGLPEARKRVEAARRVGASGLDLAFLDLTAEGLAALAPEIATLPRLQDLGLSGNQLTALPPEIATLPRLQDLDLSGNQLTALPPEIAALTRLQTLSLEGNQLTALPPEIAALSQLQTLSLEGNQLTALPPEIAALSQLQTLYLGANQLTALPPEIGALTKLEVLGLSNNQLTALPSEIAALTRLQTLLIRSNKLTALPQELRLLTHLRYLYLHDNNALGLPPEVLGPTWGESHLDGGQDPAKPSDILAFYFNLQEAKRKGPDGTRRLNECKVLVVGQPQAGKTRLVGWLITGKDPGQPQHTDGIKIGDWKVPTKPGDSGAETILAHIWDFGGQEIMQATHSFFLTERALYILVLDARDNEEQRRTHHWLERLRAFGKGSPVVVVLNKDDIPNKPPDMPQLQQDFADLIAGDLHKTCAQVTGTGIAGLRAELENRIRELPNVNAEWSKEWLDAKDEIAAITAKRRRLSEKEYREICKLKGITAPADQEALLSQLVTLGTLHRYHDPRHSGPGDVFVLDPEWVTEGVYSILNSPVLKAAGGRLRRDRLGEYFKNKEAYPPSDREFILGAMTMDQFELAFEIPGRPGEFLVPEVLSTQTPPHGIDPRAANALNAVWRYRYLPDGVISRFTVRMNEKLECGPGGAWKNGAVLYLEGCRVLVRAAPERNAVLCTVLGERPRTVAALAVVRAMLESIHSAMNLKCVDEYVCAPAGPGRPVADGEAADPWAAIDTKKRRELEDLMDDREAGPSHRVKLGGAWYTVAALLERVGLPENGPERRKGHHLTGEPARIDQPGMGPRIINTNGGDYIEGGKHMGDDRSINVGRDVINSQVGQTLTNCTSTVRQLAPGKKKDLLDKLRADVEELIKRLPEDKKAEAPQIAENLENAIKQAAKERPDRRWYGVSAEGLLEAAGWVQDFSGRIGGTIKNLGTMFWPDFSLPAPGK